MLERFTFFRSSVCMHLKFGSLNIFNPIEDDGVEVFYVDLATCEVVRVVDVFSYVEVVEPRTGSNFFVLRHAGGSRVS